MACLMESGMMDGLERTSAHELQRQIQSLILATDIARQQEFLSAFQVLWVWSRSSWMDWIESNWFFRLSWTMIRWICVLEIIVISCCKSRSSAPISVILAGPGKWVVPGVCKSARNSIGKVTWRDVSVYRSHRSAIDSLLPFRKSKVDSSVLSPLRFSKSGTVSMPLRSRGICWTTSVPIR